MLYSHFLCPYTIELKQENTADFYKHWLNKNYSLLYVKDIEKLRNNYGSGLSSFF